MIEYSNSEQSEIPGGEEFSVKVVGVGGAGANVLDRMTLEGSNEAELLTLNTDVRALSTSVSNSKIQLGKTLLMGMGAGGDPELGKQAALEAVDEIREAVRGNTMVFVCVGLGGGTGSGAGPEICRICKEEGVFLVAFTTLPFSFEGKRRLDQALEALDRISEYANAVITFENDRMGELIVPKSGVQQAFAAADNLISQSIRATMAIVQQPGLIRIGMDDLLAALEGQNARCLFGHGVAKGDHRAQEALSTALKSPLLDKGRLLENASNVLVHVSGGDTMTMFEVELLMNELTKHVSDHTQILFGTSSDAKIGDSIAVTIISSLSSGAPKMTDPEVIEEAKKPEPPKEETLNPASEPAAVSASAAALAAAADAPEKEVEAQEAETTPEPPEEEVSDTIDEEEESDLPPPLEAEPEDELEAEAEAEAEETPSENEETPQPEEPVSEKDEETPDDDESVEAEPEEQVSSESDKESAPPSTETEEAAPENESDEKPEAEPEPVEESTEAEAPETEEPAAAEIKSPSKEEPEPEIIPEPEAELASEVKKEGAAEPIISSRIKKKTIVSPVIKPKSKPVIVTPASRRPNVRISSDDTVPVGGPQPVAKIGAPTPVDTDGDDTPPISIRDLARQGRTSLDIDNENESENAANAVTAETGDAQTISLTRISPRVDPEELNDTLDTEADVEPEYPPSATPIASPQVKTAQVKTLGNATPTLRPVSSEPKIVPPKKADAADTENAEEEALDEAAAKQQQLLQLEPLSKGRFAKSEPTIVDGEDMDVPTFLRKKKK